MPKELTDDQCDEFRRLPGSFNDMVRAIYKAGLANNPQREVLEQIIDGAVKHSSCEYRITAYAYKLAQKSLKE